MKNKTIRECKGKDMKMAGTEERDTTDGLDAVKDQHGKLGEI